MSVYMANYNKVSVWRHTKDWFKDKPAVNSVKWDKGGLDVDPVGKYEKTSVQVVFKDIIDIALSMRRRGHKPLLLSSAEIDAPGGSVEDGGAGQEECCFRRSDYFRHLDKKKMYPLVGSQVIYSQDVEFIKANESTGNRMLDHSVKLDIVAVSAIRNPQLNSTHSNYAFDEDYRIMTQKVDMMFRTAQHYSHDCLILSAFGCSEYGNPPRSVVQIFRTAIKKWDKSLDKIIFGSLGGQL